MSSDTDDDGQNTRPISVAELLARNGTIGAPPVGGRRRRRRGNSAAVTVAELTGEIPVIRDEPMVTEPVSEPVPEPVADVEPTESALVTDESVAAPDAEPEVEPTPAEQPASAVETASDTGSDADHASEPAQESEDTLAIEPELERAAEAEPEPVAEAEPESASVGEVSQPAESSPPRATDPRPHRSRSPERSYDPRPKRRPSGAEQMSPDPVDESVDIAGLVADQAAEEEQLRSYLTSSGGALFSGETVADDLARRGISGDAAAADALRGPAQRPAVARPGGRLAAVRHAVVAVLQSVLAVAFGAGMFVAFDQLWRWNTIVALVLSVLVILGLVIAVRVVRKTEDIASTLIAVAVGALVTLGPLALLQSYG